jgi:hypothetical protein
VIIKLKNHFEKLLGEILQFNNHSCQKGFWDAEYHNNLIITLHIIHWDAEYDSVVDEPQLN